MCRVYSSYYKSPPWVRCFWQPRGIFLSMIGLLNSGTAASLTIPMRILLKKETADGSLRLPLNIGEMVS